MFLEHFRLRQQPFGVTPDPSFLFPSRTFREALAALTAGIEEGRGFLALIAEPGMGKTTLLYHLFEQLRDSARTALLFQTQCDSREFFQYLLSELGVDSSGMGLVAMHNNLNEMLFAEMLAGKRFVLVVDEAQNLTEPVLETVRLLSNFETSHTKLLQIILCGQPQLAEKLAQPRLEQLRQRIAVVARLEPLSVAETCRYIEHRLQIGGHCGAPVFAPEACERIALESGGVPRSINNICFAALSAAHAAGLEAVTPEIVNGVISRLSIDLLATPAPRAAAAAAAKAAPAAPAAPPQRPAPPPATPVRSVTPTLAAPQPAVAARPVVAPAAKVTAPVSPPPQLSYAKPAKADRTPWASRSTMLAALLVFTALSFSPFVARYLPPWRATAAPMSPERTAAAFPPTVASEFGPVNFGFSADPEDTARRQAGPPPGSRPPGHHYRILARRFDDARTTRAIIALMSSPKSASSIHPSPIPTTSNPAS